MNRNPTYRTYTATYGVKMGKDPQLSEVHNKAREIIKDELGSDAFRIMNVSFSDGDEYRTLQVDFRVDLEKHLMDSFEQAETVDRCGSYEPFLVDDGLEIQLRKDEDVKITDVDTDNTIFLSRQNVDDIASILGKNTKCFILNLFSESEDTILETYLFPTDHMHLGCPEDIADAYHEARTIENYGTEDFEEILDEKGVEYIRTSTINWSW